MSAGGIENRNLFLRKAGSDHPADISAGTETCIIGMRILQEEEQQSPLLADYSGRRNNIILLR
jgi:hypothetical protein